MSADKEKIASAVRVALKSEAVKSGVSLPPDFDILMERPKIASRGEWATNAAMKFSKQFGLAPMELAGRLAASVSVDKSGIIEEVEAVAPGFLNFTLARDWVGEAIKTAVKMGEAYGSNDLGRGRRVQVEFVSANPTGPIHLGHGRGGVVGDVLASILAFSGWEVEREYYVNDAGLQMENLGHSTRSRYFALYGREDEAPFPEGGYPGDYIDGIARVISREYGDSLLSRPIGETIPIFRDRTRESVLGMIKRDLSDFGINFDVWFSEKSLYDDDLAERTIDLLKKNGYAYESDGAVWFKATAFGDDKDRVMIRNNGVPTYFTSDTAYLLNKYERKFDFLIYIWGADHHGYVPRIRSVNKALGKKDDGIEFLLIQFVSLLRDGEPVSMSKRAGTFVTLREVMDEVGRDAARFSFVNRKCDSHLEFDLEVAKRTSSENPVYYVQYAHARISGILREAALRGIALPDVEDVDLGLLSDPCEIRLAKEISRFPEEVERASSALEPHRVAFYASSLAEAFHSFYNSLKVLGESPDLMNARLTLAEASRVTISNALRLLGVSAPEKM
ncbi:MAG: arginine--tRNA ligase [Synergistaceae bacterium]|jgi:arginyl-tRNA synthetase|nr:arginine--tRNA ligase [Synergistaceae bacterium]